MANNKVTKFGLKAATPIETDLDGWKKVDGNPTMKTWIEYTADDGSSISGWWGATPGTYHATYAAPEFVHMIQGEIVITPDGGKPVTVKGGDAFTVEKDFVGKKPRTRLSLTRDGRKAFERHVAYLKDLLE